MIDTGGGEQIVDLADTTQTHTQVYRPCRTTIVIEVTTVNRTFVTVAFIVAVAVAVAVEVVDITIAID